MSRPSPSPLERASHGQLRMPRPALSLLTSAALLLLASVATPFDRVLLKDGRAIDGKLIESADPDFVMLRLPGADVPIPNTLIDRTFVESLEDYVPKNKKEEKLIKQGKVLFEGSWMSKSRREQMLKKRRDADKLAIEKLREDQKWSNRKRISTRHFDIQSNCTQQVLDEYAERIETYYGIFIKFWNIKLSPSEGKDKMNFYLYRNKPDFHAVTGKPFGVGGFFDFTQRELQLYDDQQNSDEARDTLQHEANHLLTYLINTKFEYPRWMNEGMAEYFGAAEIDEEGDIHLGGLQYARIAMLRSDVTNDNTLAIRDVLLATPREYGYQHYGYGWSFVHFLMESPEYGKTFRSFFKNLHKNRDIEVTNVSYSNVKGALASPQLQSVIEVLEKELGKSIEELEDEMRVYQEQAYGELSAYGFFRAARMSRRESLPDGQHVLNAITFYEKACELGYDNAVCYREYAEILRKGGLDERGGMNIVIEPDPARAWEYIQTAIELDPIDPLNYLEAAGALIMESDVQDLDRAFAMASTAIALSPRSYSVQSLHDELMALIEPARESARERAEQEERLAKMDPRRWIVQPFFFDGDEAPERSPEMSTDELRELLQSAVYSEKDWVIQVYRWPDEVTGELLEGTEAWDVGWTALSEVPLFAEDLKAGAG